jgi:hypothetical protein
VSQEPPSVVLVVLLLEVLVEGADDEVALLDVVVVEVVLVELAAVDEVVATVDVVVEVVTGTVDVVDALMLVDVEDVVRIDVVAVLDVVVEVVLLVLLEVDVVTGGADVVVVPPGTGPVQAENSEVSPSGAVAVAVITWPATSDGSGKARSASPDASVTTSIPPRNTAPSPLPLASHDGLEKNSTVNVVDGRLLSVPVTCDADTVESTG